MESAGLVWLLPPYFSGREKPLVSSPKVYFTDTGLAAWLCGFASPEALQRDAKAPAFFETFVITEILKSWRHNGLAPDLCFYAAPEKRIEIDLLIHTDGKWHPVKAAIKVFFADEAIRHFAGIKRLGLSVGTGAVIYPFGEVKGLCDEVTSHSVWSL